MEVSQPGAPKEPELASKEQRATARHALETALACFLGIGYNVAALNYVFSPSPGLAAVLRVTGTLHVDVTVLYFMLCGFEAAEARGGACNTGENPVSEDEESRIAGLVGSEDRRWAHTKAVLGGVLPDLCLSTILHIVLQGFTCLGCSWDWVNTALSPLLLSAFVDVRPANVFRAVNEVSWVVQTNTLLLLLFSQVASQARAQAASALYGLLFLWATSFGQIYLAATQPENVNIVTRNIFTNVVFFAYGILVWEARRGGAARESLGAPLASVSGWQVRALGVLVLFVYAQHLVEWGGYGDGPCVSLFGGAPCLWTFDAANARLLPLLAYGLLWFTDDGGLFPPRLGGELAEPLTHTLRHVTAKLAQGRRHAVPWMLYGSFIAFGLHRILFFLLPETCAANVHLLVPVETALVAVLTAYLHEALEPYLRDAFARVCATLPAL